MNEELIRIYQSIRKYARTIGGVDENAELAEVCDFGDSFGFLFSTDDVFANLYWCVEKETYKPYSYRPNMDMEKFLNRKIMPTDIVG